MYSMRFRRRAFRLAMTALPMLSSTVFAVGMDPPASLPAPARGEHRPLIHKELQDQPYRARTAVPERVSGSPQGRVPLGPYVSVQVNIDRDGQNIWGDAANEPSIAIDPTDPSRIVIGWREFDTIESNFRQAGWAWSHNGGRTWTFPGVIDPGEFRSDPVLDVDLDGSFYYYSIRCGSPTCGDIFKSTNGGVTWEDPVFAFGGDKPWMAIDRTDGIGQGNIYIAWSGNDNFTRSSDGGNTFLEPVDTPIADTIFPSTMTVGPEGNVYFPGAAHKFVRSTNAANPAEIPEFELLSEVDLGGQLEFMADPNPAGLLGQTWVDIDRSRENPSYGYIYLLASVRPQSKDPLEVMFVRSTDGGFTWSDPVRVNDDDDMTAWQWFGTMAVAPNGRIDALWNDTRNTGLANLSELYYSYSSDAGVTWSKNVPVSPVFDSHIGWPQQQKLGDYYDMISDDTAVNVAYAATFNDEQDVYFLRIGFPDADNDRDVDLRDFAGFQNCFTGEGGGVSEGCTLFDVDRDTDVDRTDYMGLSNLLIGP